jgi:SAM-dependent methyltransferase
VTGDWAASLYGDNIADVYDDWYPPGPEVAAAVDALARLAGDGPVLELGIGTGRLALPLAARGVTVHGVDSSAAMTEVLRAKPGAERLEVVVGDMADCPAPLAGGYSLVFVAFNTFFLLPSEDAQRRCLRRAAERLAPGGAVVIEAFVPDPSRYDDAGSYVRALEVDAGRVVLEVSRHRGQQRVDSQRVVITETGIRLFPLQLRYATVDQLDAMAAGAGLALESRWAGWDGQPFTADARQHVSLWRHVTGAGG